MVTQTHIGIDSIVEELNRFSSDYTIKTTAASLIGELIVSNQAMGSGTILTEQAVFEQVIAVEYLAWLLAERIEGESPTIHIIPDGTLPPMATDGSLLLALIETGGFIGGITTDDEQSLAFATERIRDSIAVASTVELSQPPLGIVEDHFAERTSLAAAVDYFDCLTQLWPLQLVGQGYDTTELAVIVAANEGGFLADIGDWARAIDLGTEADISRAKRKLQDDGIISVTEEPMGVGRPRHRLHLEAKQVKRVDRTDLDLIESILLG